MVHTRSLWASSPFSLHLPSIDLSFTDWRRFLLERFPYAEYTSSFLLPGNINIWPENSAHPYLLALTFIFTLSFKQLVTRLITLVSHFNFLFLSLAHSLCIILYSLVAPFVIFLVLSSSVDTACMFDKHCYSRNVYIVVPESILMLLCKKREDHFSFASSVGSHFYECLNVKIKN